LFCTGLGQLYFGSLQKIWPLLLQLHLTRACEIVSFVSFTSDILKYHLDICGFSKDVTHLSTLSCDEKSILSCQVSIIETFTLKILSGLFEHCSNLFEVKKCLGLFTRISNFNPCPNDLCSTILEIVTTSSLVQHILKDWLSCQSSTAEVCYVRDMFGVTTINAEVDDSDKSLLAAVVRKLLVLTIKCLSVSMASGKGLCGKINLPYIIIFLCNR